MARKEGGQPGTRGEHQAKGGFQEGRGVSMVKHIQYC